MIGYATVGTNDIDRARAFYDALSGPMPGLHGPEGDNAFYGPYFRDLDGNKSAFSARVPPRTPSLIYPLPFLPQYGAGVGRKDES